MKDIRLKLTVKLPIWWRLLLALASFAARCGLPVDGDRVVQLIISHTRVKAVIG